MARSTPDLHFDLNSRLLQGRERRKLEQAAPDLESLLYDYPDLIIVVEGYSDDSGLIERNERLALRRADTVRRILLELSFPEERLYATGFGSRAPQCATADEVCRSSNRRVRFRAAQAAPAPKAGGKSQ
jgi:outer membrane protein OmpA-like peptidoglycan-associated protein